MPRMFLLLVLAGCPEYGYHEKVEDPGIFRAGIEVEPALLDFGELADNTFGSQSFVIRSVGDVTLDLGTLTVSGGAFTLLGTAPDSLAAGEEAEIFVQFEPTAPDDIGQVSIPSSDPDLPVAIVELIGQGLVPILAIDPPAVDFGVVQTGTPQSETLRLSNEGSAPLTVDDLVLTGAGFTAIPHGAPPFDLEPGKSTEIVVTWDTSVTGTYDGDLWVDASTGPQVVPLDGVAAELPVAVCSVTPVEVQAHEDNATWIGVESFTPDGEPITNYEWTLIGRPAGSTASLSGSGANRAFFPDLAGIYTAELTVATASGLRSEPCTTTLLAFPGQSLWIELFWSHSGDDMDLHLLAPGGTLTTNGDCFYWNCVGGGLDWGLPSVSEDDPSLDFDDIPGKGPENINVWEPANGTFSVYVHDFPGHWYDGDNNVTVNIFVFGVLAWTETRILSGDDIYHPFAEVEFPSGVVTPL